MRCVERWLVAAAVLLFAHGLLIAGDHQLVQRERHSMGTMFRIVVSHPSVAAAEAAVDEAMAEILRLEAVMSHYRSDSDLSRLNREGGLGAVEVPANLFEVISEALEVSRLSNGAFDVTIAPLLRVWKAAHEAGRRPTAAEIDRAAACVGYAKVELSAPDRIRFRTPCVELDLGGIGKGFAVDRALAILEAAGIRDALVNAGGSTIAARGAAPGYDGWPVELAGDVAGRRTLLLQNAAISSSQQRGRPFPFAEGMFGEIIDPQQRAPTGTRRIVSVVTGSATRADALSTALLLMPIEEGTRRLARFPSTSALWMSPDGALEASHNASRLVMVGAGSNATRSPRGRS